MGSGLGHLSRLLLKRSETILTQREVGLEACYSRGGICRGVDSRRASPLKRMSEALGELGGCPRNCVEWKGFDLEGLARTDPTPSRGSRGYRPFCTAARTNVDFKKLDSFLRIMWIFTTLSHLCLEARQAVPPGAGGNAHAGESACSAQWRRGPGDAGPRRFQARTWSAHAPLIQSAEGLRPGHGAGRTRARPGSLAQATLRKRGGPISSSKI